MNKLIEIDHDVGKWQHKTMNFADKFQDNTLYLENLSSDINHMLLLYFDYVDLEYSSRLRMNEYIKVFKLDKQNSLIFTYIEWMYGNIYYF